jgi:hypothetical protein
MAAQGAAGGRASDEGPSPARLQKPSGRFPQWLACRESGLFFQLSDQP